jgi:Tfp pilus assembly protein PilW
MSTRTGQRAGMTLVELTIGLVVAMTLLAGMTGLFISESRLFGNWEAQRTARDVVRSAAQVLAADIRRLDPTGGIEAATDSSLILRVPITMGLVCSSTVGATVVSLPPTDSVTFATAAIDGQAWRTNTGYTYLAATTTSSPGAADCTAAGISTITGGRVLSVSPGAGTGVRSGTVLLLYQRVQYRFVTGSQGMSLTRRTLAGGGTTETIVETLVPDDTRFRFYVGASATAQDAPPADLTTLRGIELALEGKGEYHQAGAESPASRIAQGVFFRNSPN